ncbi:thioredoxin family protein [Aestuariibaculum marinum]|uniref:Thioredoxin family protein n=1 Tax=Aestuariibaculum marinum TaxID=2683592 RepID=A0A8J6QAZ7_9FLAO|nr:thioredoxin family protein [Aestuariibaculum marinum]MBD0824241.1 thioredoxin family protein [Aestuariibaculum marinum]
MKKNVLTLMAIVLLGVFNLSAQGIEFQHISLEEALEKAKAEDKLVFIDFYTTWCAPCKAMAKNVFTLPEVGAVYNKEYINIKLDAEKEGLKSAKKYLVNSYPTYIYLNANGNIVYKETGMRLANNFIQLGRDAVASENSQFSLEKLRAKFPNKQDDAGFLKIYFTKVQEYGQNPTEGINAWLKVQTEIEEDDVDMMEFLLKNKDYIILKSKGEEILKVNFDEYMDIATRKEEKELQIFEEVRLAQNTKNYALETKNPELWFTFMQAFNTLPEKYKKRGNYLEYKITYYALLKDSESYKMAVENYVDSLMVQNTSGKTKSGAIVQDLSNKGEAYLKYADSKSDYKTLENWIEYGNELGASIYYMDNLMADMFYKKGKRKKALDYKEKAIANWPKGDKKLSTKKYELEQMKKGELI